MDAYVKYVCSRKIRFGCVVITGMIIIGLLYQSSKDNFDLSADDTVFMSRLIQKIRLMTTSGTNDAKATGDNTAVDNVSLLRENSFSSISTLTDSVMDGMSFRQLKLTFLTVVDNVEVVCSRKLRFGNIADGGWDICDDADIRPGKDCVVYSFGINNDFSFDDMVASSYGCHVYSFDPSMKANTHDRSALVHFYKLGIAGKTQVLNGKGVDGWKMYTLGDLRTLLNHTRTVIDVIKMDVESSEWGALPPMIASGALRGVKQLLVEFHVNKDRIVKKDRDTVLQYLKTIKSLHDAGFRVFYPHKNQYTGVKVDGFPATSTLCFEVHFINTNWKLV